MTNSSKSITIAQSLDRLFGNGVSTVSNTSDSMSSLKNAVTSSDSNDRIINGIATTADITNIGADSIAMIQQFKSNSMEAQLLSTSLVKFSAGVGLAANIASIVNQYQGSGKVQTSTTIAAIGSSLGVGAAFVTAPVAGTLLAVSAAALTIYAIKGRGDLADTVQQLKDVINPYFNNLSSSDQSAFSNSFSQTTQSVLNNGMLVPTLDNNGQISGYSAKIPSNIDIQSDGTKVYYFNKEASYVEQSSSGFDSSTSPTGSPTKGIWNIQQPVEQGTFAEIYIYKDGSYKQDFIDSRGNAVNIELNSSNSNKVLSEQLTTKQKDDNKVSAIISGTGDIAVLNNATVTLIENASATVVGENNSIKAGDNSKVILSDTNNNIDLVVGNNATIILEPNVQTNVFGKNNTVTNTGANDTVGVYGGSNTINTQADDLVVLGNTDGQKDIVNAYNDTSGGTNSWGGTGIYLNDNTIADVYGDNYQVTETGENDYVNNYGSGDINYFQPNDSSNSANSPDYNYTSNGGDNGSYGGYDGGSSGDNSGNYSEYAGGGGGGGGGNDSYFNSQYYGFAGNKSMVAATVGSNIDTVAKYDQAHGGLKRGTTAEMAKIQVQFAIASGGDAIFTGSKLDHNVITWSLADHGAQFSRFMGKSDEAAVQVAFAAWGTASGLTFEKVDDSSQSDIRLGLGFFDTANTGVIGYTSFQSKGGVIHAGSVVRVEDSTQDALTMGKEGQLTYATTDATFSQVLMHEIGHALGLADNADVNSIENYYLGASNQKLDSNDVLAIRGLYGSSSGYGDSSTQNANQLIQAMASFAPAPGVSTAILAANNPAIQPLLVATSH